MEDREWLMDRRFAGMNLGLQRIESLLLKMDNPQLDFPSIHVAGTNGKGTLCAFLSSAQFPLMCESFVPHMKPARSNNQQCDP